MDRYASAAMRALWSDAAAYDRWRQVEIAVLAARSEGFGSAPLTPAEVQLSAEALAQAQATPAPDPRQVHELEQATRHDVVAFLLAWTADMPPRIASQIHHGLTSSDVVDTATAIVLRDVSALIDEKATRLLRVLSRHARAHGATLRLARTHGQPAGPDTWGHRVADFGFAIARTRDRLRTSATTVATAKISGPVGSYTGVTRAVEISVAARLGLAAPPSATQVLSRDAIAAWASDCAAIASVCEAIATEVRLGATFEVGELEEQVLTDQVGSSAIPSKRNPIRSEKVTGLARVLRGSVGPLLEDVALWHHRDISQSSVERVELPLISKLTEHAVDTTLSVIEGLVVHTDRMRANLTSAGLLAAGPAVLDHLTAVGVPRLEALRAVESATAEARAQNVDGSDPERANRCFCDTIDGLTNVALPFGDPLAYAIAQAFNSDAAAVFDRLEQVAAA